jgi:hypothetical protein
MSRVCSYPLLLTIGVGVVLVAAQRTKVKPVPRELHPVSKQM